MQALDILQLLHRPEAMRRHASVTPQQAIGGFVAIVNRETREVSLAAAQGLPDSFTEHVDLSSTAQSIHSSMPS